MFVAMLIDMLPTILRYPPLIAGLRRSPYDVIVKSLDSDELEIPDPFTFLQIPLRLA